MRTVCLALSLVLLGGCVWGQEFEIEYLPEPPGATESSARAINAQGVVAGYVKIGDTWRQAVVWDRDEILILPTPEGYVDAMAMFITNAGTVVGQLMKPGLPPGRFIYHVFVWDRKNGLRVILDVDMPEYSLHVYEVEQNGTIYGVVEPTNIISRSSFVWSAKNGFERIELAHSYDVNQGGTVAGDIYLGIGGRPRAAVALSH